MLRGTLPWTDPRLQQSAQQARQQRARAKAGEELDGETEQSRVGEALSEFQASTAASLKAISSLLICEGLPAEVAACLEYAKNMEPDERPDYSFIRKMLRQLALRKGQLIGPGGAEWTWLHDGFDIEQWALDRAGKVRVDGRD
eukprot:gnl/Chilomastix_caulleri/2536.p1 GENE.gnl/Chilomastix_caulleri/2536~~gnl/Chilomastix_caulleri/2536.p1  ORF type:complete len:143 (+),score=14.86 gnl/Chilomastix_caulleri/2536:229-657(+)